MRGCVSFLLQFLSPPRKGAPCVVVGLSTAGQLNVLAAEQTKTLRPSGSHNAWIWLLPIVALWYSDTPSKIARGLSTKPSVSSRPRCDLLTLDASVIFERKINDSAVASFAFARSSVKGQSVTKVQASFTARTTCEEQSESIKIIWNLFFSPQPLRRISIILWSLQDLEKPDQRG